MSLKCPLSTLRIDVPCRSTICNHNQCFDATSFLQLQEQAPTWTCPVCNKVISFEALTVDQYVNEILKSTPRAVDQVTIEPDGKWSQTSPNDGTPRPNGAASSDEYDDDDDDDLVEIRDMPRLSAVKSEVISTPVSLARTPPYSSREPSTHSTAPRSSNGKRPISQVIDLTFSDDEDDEPPRGPKRHAPVPTPTSAPPQSASSSLSSYQRSLGGGWNGENSRPNSLENSRSNGLNFTFPTKSTPTRPPEPLHYRPNGYNNPP